MISNSKFKKLSYLDEIGESKVNTVVLLKVLLNFLRGRKPYTNTQFTSNLSKTGVLKIIKDMENENLINLPQKVKKDILKSIETSSFMLLINKTKELLCRVNNDNIKKIINNYVLLFNQYVNDLHLINNPIIQQFNSKIKEKLLTQYRIEAKTSIIKTFEIFKKYLNLNQKIYAGN